MPRHGQHGHRCNRTQKITVDVSIKTDPSVFPFDLRCAVCFPQYHRVVRRLEVNCVLPCKLSQRHIPVSKGRRSSRPQ
jgi:hypothetical protein